MRKIILFVISILCIASSADATTLAISGQTGVVLRGLTITNSTGPCITITNSSNIVIKESYIGPCGTDNTTSDSQGIKIAGSSSIDIYDNYIHVERKAASGGAQDTHANILVRDSSFVNVKGNIIGYGESNVQVDDVPASQHIVVEGNFLFQPRGPFPRGQNVQIYAQDGSNRIDNVTVQNNYTVCDNSAVNSGFSSGLTWAYECAQEDSLSFGWLGNNVLIDTNYVRGGQSNSGCGITFDVGMLGGIISNNIVPQYNCTVQWTSGGTNTGTGTVTGNKGQVTRGSINGAAFIVGTLGFHTTPCGGVNVTNNTFTSTGGNGSHYDDGGCNPVSYTANTIDPSYGICQPGYGSTPAPSCTAYFTLNVLTTTNPPPLIPPGPVNCVVASPFTTQTSKPAC